MLYRYLRKISYLLLLLLLLLLSWKRGSFALQKPFPLCYYSLQRETAGI